MYYLKADNKTSHQLKIGGKYFESNTFSLLSKKQPEGSIRVLHLGMDISYLFQLSINPNFIFTSGLVIIPEYQSYSHVTAPGKYNEFIDFLLNTGPSYGFIFHINRFYISTIMDIRLGIPLYGKVKYSSGWEEDYHPLSIEPAIKASLGFSIYNLLIEIAYNFAVQAKGYIIVNEDNSDMCFLG